MSLRGFIRAFRLAKHAKEPTAPTSLARTVKDAMSPGGSGLATGASGTNAEARHIASGHANYAKSFEKEA